ncbi:ABC transporter substrate-binding protein [Pseudohalocynthiibacter sp. F2068]|uniref:ABC transporter substrate-binding protein n=1 Tax=Pseudohalocynthiibacter sp. F2068 TaxID=2926418 RepID=UPI001FF100E1|nr:ABC transporter substrate-binding protein [Pseudohalocynthiibacter sp. F2068]MCK0103247.1 ABC transporter substrate-binding protein [Pseudohalocynthiibacter sp. F2068]
MKTLYKYRNGIAGMSIGIGLALSATYAAAFQNEVTVRIGSTEPLTGVAAVLGQPNYIGKLIAVDEINAAGGIMIDGERVMIELISEDDQAKPDQGIAIFRKLEGSDRVLAISGTQYSRVTESMWGLLQKNLDDPSDNGLRVPSISFLSMKAGVASISPWAFRNAGKECDQHEQLMALMEEHKGGGSWDSVVVGLESNEAHSVAAWRACYDRSLQSRDLEPSEFVEWFESDTDYSVQIRRMRRADPDLFILSSHYQANVGAMLEMARQGVRPEYIMGHIGSDAVEMIDLGGEAVEGVVFPSTAFFRNPGVQDLYEEYKARTGEWYMPAFTYLGYEGIYILKWAIENAGIKNLPETLEEDRRKVRDQLASMENWVNPIGLELTVEETGDITREYVYVQIKDGDFKLWWHPERGFIEH